MKLKSLFSKLIAPKKDGDSGQDLSTDGKNYQFHLQASNIEGQPTYPLTDFLAIGSEIGDVVLDDPSLSAKHCTFFLKENVISVIDHNSVEGTFINDKKISSGKMIILQDGDYVRAGELEFDILKHELAATTVSQAAPVEVLKEVVSDELSLDAGDQSTSDDLSLGEPEQGDDISLDSDISLDESFEKHIEKKEDATSAEMVKHQSDRTGDIDPTLLAKGTNLQEKTSELKPGFFSSLFKRNKKKVEPKESAIVDEKVEESILQKAKIKKTKNYGKLSNQKKSGIKLASKVIKEKLANPLVRTMALLIDVLIVASLVVIIMPYGEFDIYAAQLQELIVTNYKEYLFPLIDTYLVEFDHYISLALKAIVPLLPFLKYFYLFIAYRFVSALVLTKTLGQLFMGIRSPEGFIWSRIGGLLREFFAVLFLPLLPIFDAPVLVGIKSFKEALSFTRLEMPKIGFAWFGGIILLPLSIVLLLVSPLMMGFDLNIDGLTQVNEKKLNNLQAEYNGQSEFLSLKMITGDLAPLVGVSLDIEMRAGKSQLVPYLNLSQDQRTFKLTLKSSFKLGDLIQKMELFDYLFAQHYPTLSNYSHEVGEINPNFSRKVLKGKDLEVFKNEFKDYLTRSMSMNIQTLEKQVLERGPFLLGYVRVKRWLLQQTQFASFQNINFINIGELPYLAITGNTNENQREMVLIPVINEKGLVYAFSLPKDMPVLEAVDQLEKNILPYISVTRDGEKLEGKSSGDILAFDLISDLIRNTNSVDEDLEYLFHERLSEILSYNKDYAEYTSKIVDFYINHFTALRSEMKEQTDLLDNLLKYLNQAKDALDNNDFKFFTIVKNAKL